MEGGPPMACHPEYLFLKKIEPNAFKATIRPSNPDRSGVDIREGGT